MDKNLFQSLQSKSFLQYSYLRSLVYLMEGLPINAAFRAFTPMKRSPPRDYMSALLRETKTLFEMDAHLMKDRILRLNESVAPNPVKHVENLSKIWLDLPLVLFRRRNQEHKAFRKRAHSLGEQTPEYYRRNFHFQTDGYLSKRSAEIYDHQVEILFRGAANPMRRLLFRPLDKFLSETKGTPHLLELGSGNGSLSLQVLSNFPNVRLTCVDLSGPYLKMAQQRLAKFDNVDFVQADVAQMPFKDHSFDGVISSFMFHEMPTDVRDSVFSEIYRTVKKGGFVGIVDAIQKDDNVQLQWGLDQFPKDFHEPFFKSYVDHPLEALFEKHLGVYPEKTEGLFSKALCGIVGETSPGQSRRSAGERKTGSRQH